MPKLTKRVIDALKPAANDDVFAWDSDLKGFGVRVKPSGARSYIIQYRNAEGRLRRMVIGKAGTLTPDEARAAARERLVEVAKGGDPSATRQAVREAPTVAEICDWYLEEATAGTLLGRRGRPIKPGTLAMDRSRIETHVKPLLGRRTVRSLTLADIERFQGEVAAGKTAQPRRPKRGGVATGGAGSAGRTISMLHAILEHAARRQRIETNPARGVRRLAPDVKRDRSLSARELAALGKAMREAEAEFENRTGLAAIRLLLTTGFRRMEALGLQDGWVHAEKGYIRFPDTKSGPQIRPIGKAALAVIRIAPRRPDSPFVFAAEQGEGHFIGLPRVLARVCARAKLTGVSPHVLRHTFASTAAEIGFTELTVAALLGHASRGVTQRYIHLDEAIRVAADKVSAHMAHLLDGRAASRHVQQTIRSGGGRPASKRSSQSEAE